MRFMRRCGLMLALIGTLAVPTTAATAGVPPPSPEEIRRYRAAAWGWQRLMGIPLTPNISRRATEDLAAFRTRALNVWKARAERAWNRGKRPPHLGEWRCIHRHEGPWRDPDAPYFGGLQMDLTFQRTYGLRRLREKGTADRWTRLEQMWTAERALRAGRGFWPWPVAARRCGLL